MTRHEHIKLKRTTVFRLSMTYAICFCLLALLVSLLIYLHVLKEANKQANAGLRAEAIGLSLIAQHDPALLTRIIQDRSTAESIRISNRNDTGPRFYLLVNDQGQLLAGDLPDWQAALAQQGNVILATIDLPMPKRLRHLVENHANIHLRSFQTLLPDGSRLFIAQSLNELSELYHEMLVLVVIVVLIMVGAGVGGGWLIGRTVLHNLNQVVSAADQIMTGDLSQRIHIARQTDEFGFLAQRLNLMLARIETLMTDLHDVTENIAHDLRTPLTRLRTHAETALLQTHDPVSRNALETAIRESDGLVRTLEALLRIAQVESGRRQEWQTLNLTELCADSIDFYEPLADTKQLTLDLQVPEQPLLFTGDPQLLAQALGNLLDNAIKYTPAGGRIALRLTSQHGRIQLTVSDTGPGIPASLRDKALQRFVRLDNSRTLPGNGLGLALVAAIVRQHNGELALTDTQPNQVTPGLTVRITLPQTV